MQGAAGQAHDPVAGGAQPVRDDSRDGVGAREPGEEGKEGLTRSQYDPAERGPISDSLVGSRTDLESRIMPRPCWNFWGHYWPISRVSDHLRTGPVDLGICPPLRQKARSVPVVMEPIPLLPSKHLTNFFR